MANDRARLLLHPVRMRVLIALSGEELTTRQIGTILTDVPQASLYRAIAQLHEAGVIEVVEEVRRGGALERTYRTVPDSALITPREFTSVSAEEFLATVQTFSDIIVGTAARHVAAEPETWREHRFGLRHEDVWLTTEQREELAEDLRLVYEKHLTRDRAEGARPWALMVATIPDDLPAREEPDAPENGEPAEGDRAHEDSGAQD